MFNINDPQHAAPSGKPADKVADKPSKQAIRVELRTVQGHTEYYATVVPISDEESARLDEERAHFWEQLNAEHGPDAMSVDAILGLDTTFRQTVERPWALGMENLHEHKRCTQAYIDYYYRMQDNAAFVYYVKIPPHNGTYSSPNGTIYPHSTAPDTLRRMLLEMTISRDVGDFQYYLTRILQHVAVQHSEARVALFPKKSHQAKPPDELADELSQQGLANVVTQLNKCLGLGYDTDNPDFRAAREVIEVRNIIAHHEGRVSQRYLSKTGRTDIKKGQVYPLSVEYVVSAGEKLLAVARALDGLFVAKFDVAV